MLNERVRRELSRREAIRLVGVGAAVPVVSLWASGAGRLAASWQAPRTSVRNVTFPKGAIIRTLLKDIPPEALADGVTLFHDNLSEAHPAGRQTWRLRRVRPRSRGTGPG